MLQSKQQNIILDKKKKSILQKDGEYKNFEDYKKRNKIKRMN